MLRRDAVDSPHFRTPTVLPVLAILSCLLLLLAQQTPATWARAGLLLGAGTLLYLVSGGRARALAHAAARAEQAPPA